MKLVTLPVSNLRNIPAMLRQTADTIEAGEHGDVTAAVLAIDTDEAIETFGFGDADTVRAVGLLTMAAMRIGA